MDSITQISERLKNFSRDYIRVNNKLSIQEIDQLCYETYSFRLGGSIEDPESKALLIYPKLFCLKPFCLVYTPYDEFYDKICASEQLVFYVDNSVQCIENLSEIYSAVHSIYKKDLKSGVKTLSLSGELMINNTPSYKAIIESNFTDNIKKKVYNLF